MKRELRRQVRGWSESLSAPERQYSDQCLFDRFLALPQLEAVQTALLYYGVGGEPDTARLIAPLQARGIIVALPRTLPGRLMEARIPRIGAGLSRGQYGIPAPDNTCPLIDRGELDLILVPALCYDRRRRRLGQGGGYYDRYLAGFGGLSVGLCRDALLMDELPTEDHDLPVTLVLTETIQLMAGRP